MQHRKKQNYKVEIVIDKKMDKTDFKLSKQAIAMIEEVNHLPTSELEWINDMAMGIATTLKEITERIENPAKEKIEGCELIHLGAEIFFPIRSLKKEIANGIELEYYLRDLDEIVEKLAVLVEKNYLVLKNPRVRRHMRDITNAIILNLEAGPILNGLFKKFEQI